MQHPEMLANLTWTILGGEQLGRDPFRAAAGWLIGQEVIVLVRAWGMYPGES